MDYSQKEINTILEMTLALSREKDKNLLLDKILDAGMKISNCDAGTLYLYQDDQLYFKVMKTLSLHVDRGRNGETIDMPPLPMNPTNICAYTAIHKRPLNIPNVYDESKFDFSGPMKYDKITGYHTHSMITIPLLSNDDEPVGVMQLINAMDEEGTIIPFPSRLEHIIMALVSQATVAVLNIRYLEELKKQMWSFTEAMAEAIDTRTSYNASHIRMVARYTGLLVDYINKLHEKGLEEEYFSETRKEQLVLSAFLHDIGKMAVPTKIMNKPSRLADKMHDIEVRFEVLQLKYKIQFLEEEISTEEYTKKIKHLDAILELVHEINDIEFITDEKLEEVKSVLSETYRSKNEVIPYFTEEEKECLMIRRGTFTDEERKIMEGHVELTERILQKVHFGSHYENVLTWAVQHHEALNGSGYPRHLSGNEIAVDSRILAVADICDALLASDRPYKKPIPKEKAFAIMRDMASNGKLEPRFVDYLEQCI